MAELIELETPRLRLRQWLPADRVPFAALNADPVVMRYLGGPIAREASDRLASRCESLLRERGWGLWAAEHKASGQLAGFVGLHVPSAALPCSPCVEIGWRLAAQHWGQGLATEGARQALHVAFERLQLQEIVSFTTIANVRSRAVMLRLGMQEAGTFEHPDVAEGSSLRTHCLYRLERAAYSITAQQLPERVVSRKSKVLRGVVRTGLGDCAFWLARLQSHYQAKTGMKLFPGTLNLELAEEFRVPSAVSPSDASSVLRLEAAEYGGTVSVSIVPCRVLGRSAFLLRTDANEQGTGHHARTIIELATDVKLRAAHGLQDGDLVDVEIEALG